MNLNQVDLDNILQELTGSSKTFELFQDLAIYGNKTQLYDELKIRLETCIKYSHLALPALIKSIREYESKKPEKNFESISEELYQNKMHPIVMHLYYALAEPFLLRNTVKSELLYLAFKLNRIKNIFIGGVGSGEILNNLSKVPGINQEKLSVFAIDISKSAIEFCQRETYKFKTKFEAQDLDFYPLKEKYHLAELSEVIEHVRTPSKVLKNVGQQADLILVTIPIMLDVPDHLHVFNIRNILELILKADLDIIYQTIRNSFYVRQFFYFALLKSKAS